MKKHELIQDVLASCHLMSSLVICQKETVTPLDPLTWGYKCVMGDCDNCPHYKTIVPPEQKATKVTIALWGNKYDPVKKKKINNIHDYEFTLSKLAEKFDKELPKLI